ncbi:MAG: isoprenoid biosynthesis glyoxalase ElbB [Alphaproteobacteria bacterium]|nr:isoprenoid biosynthesis glyoxalase ElbB [Alphaproteobacteria bacterium]
MAHVAVILSGCGYLDGAEIRESVCTLVSLEKRGATYDMFAPDIEQRDVVNHLTGEPMQEKRNVLVEAARIARGQVRDLKEARAQDYDALLMPGGYGVAKNLSDIAMKGPQGSVLKELKNLILQFSAAEKPIGAICISPAALVASLKGEMQAHVTLGPEDPDGLIKALGGVHQSCQTRGIVIDAANHIVSTPAYMTEAPLVEVAAGIDRLVETILNEVSVKKRAA